MVDGKVALVTGSTSGIGLGIARALAGNGAHVMLNGLNDDADAERARGSIAEEFGVRTGFAAANLVDPSNSTGLVERTIDHLGGLDILINNAGIQFTAPVEEFPPDRWEAIVAINLSSAFYTTRTALPHMRRRNWGRIINVASVHGLVGSIQKSAYVAAKHGLVGLTKVVALETAESQITCNAICPGWVLTPLVEKQIGARAEKEGISVKEAELRLLVEKQPSKAFVTPEQLGELTVFLCSEAAAQITGVSLPTDGAWTAQ